MQATPENIKELVQAGAHIGHRKSRRHPKMIPFVYGRRGHTEIIDVTKTIEALEAAANFLQEKVAQRVTPLFVGTRPSHAEIVRTLAKDLRVPYVTKRWVGGTITNFAVIGKRLEAFRKLAEREASGELAERYTKAERLGFQRQLARMEEELGGIRELLRLPDVLILSSLRVDALAAYEARKKGIPVIAIVDTDTDPSLVDYAIPANDDALRSVQYILDRLAVAIREGQHQAAMKKAQQEEAAAAAASKEAEQPITKK